MESAIGINLEISKDFTVSVEQLYQAWIFEGDLHQWWHPMNNTLRHLINELHPGGKVAYTFENNEGNNTFTIEGNYKEVEPNKKLVYTWNWQLPTQAIHDSEFLLTVLFESTQDGSRLRVKQDQFANEEAVHPHREGWEKALTDLQLYLHNE